MDALQLAIMFHETYESLAPQFGYETRTETRTFDPTTPNGKLMVAVCGAIMEDNRVNVWADQTVKELSDYETSVNAMDEICKWVASKDPASAEWLRGLLTEYLTRHAAH